MGNAEVRIAILVPKIIALPKPCTTLSEISTAADGATAMKRDERVKIHMPYVNIRFLPKMSAILPRGTRNMAAAKRYDVGTQLRSTAPIWNSLPIAGSAILIDEPIKGVRNAESVAMRRADLFIIVLSIEHSRPVYRG
jgi:hypothetical protein